MLKIEDLSYLFPEDMNTYVTPEPEPIMYKLSNKINRRATNTLWLHNEFVYRAIAVGYKLEDLAGIREEALTTYSEYLPHLVFDKLHNIPKKYLRNNTWTCMSLK